MKRLFLILCLVASLVLPMVVYSVGTTTLVPNVVRGMDGSMSFFLTLTATADSSDATFVPVLIDQNTNAGAYADIYGKWMTSARTTIPLAIHAPTANYDIYIVDGVNATSDFVLTTPTLAIGTTASQVSTIAFNYVINNVSYAKTAVAAGTAPGNDIIPQSKYGAVALDIGANGTIDAIEASGNAAGTYTSAALAIAGVAAAASDHVRLGYVTATKSDGAFTFGTTALNVANSTVAYTSTIPQYDIMGGRLTNRSATVNQEVYPANTAGDNAYIYIKKPIMIIPVNNSVNSAVFTLDLIFN